MSNLSEKIEDIRTLLKRCKPEVIEAAVQYQSERSPEQVPVIVMGIIERYLEPESRSKLKDPNNENFSLIEDLGVDSLIIVEIVMAIEETLSISIPDQDLKELRKIKDVKEYIAKKASEPKAAATV